MADPTMIRALFQGSSPASMDPAQWRLLQEAYNATPDSLGAINDAGAGVGYRMAHSLNFTAPDNNPQTGNMLVDSAPIAFGLLGGIKAYHGSPHDFNAFDMSKIGTGEGAQAYGHGLYFAENPAVSETYKFANQPAYMGSIPQRHAMRAMKDAANAGLDGDEAIKYARNILNDYAKNAGNTQIKQEYFDAANNLDSFVKSRPGKMYEVSIDAHPDEFLDWDKPLSEQSQKVQEALKAVAPQTEQFGPGYLPRHLGMLKTPEGAEALRAAGIKGIRYADQGSRKLPSTPSNDIAADWLRENGGDPVKALTAYDNYIGQSVPPHLRDSGINEIRDAIKSGNKPPKQTSNYVIFDDKTINILRKYGLAGLTAGLGGAAAMSGASPQPSVRDSIKQAMGL